MLVGRDFKMSVSSTVRTPSFTWVPDAVGQTPRRRHLKTPLISDLTCQAMRLHLHCESSLESCLSAASYQIISCAISEPLRT